MGHYNILGKVSSGISRLQNYSITAIIDLPSST
uniref:Uncharacterized protein n=1 Tax=Anguilla anguilla TaxID=7936 RepID=A0A0E9RAS5_ANGAN